MSSCRLPPPSLSIVIVQFLGQLTTAGSDEVGSGARRRQGGRVSFLQRHIDDIPVRMRWHWRSPQPLPIVGVPQFPDLSKRYNTSGGRGRGVGVEAAGTSEPVRIAALETFLSVQG